MRRDRGDPLRHVGRQHLVRAQVGEGGPAGEHLVGHRTEGVHVRAVVDVRVAGRLLGRHIRGRAEGDADRGEPGVTAGSAQRLRHPEIGHEGVVIRDQNVVGLDVTVHHAARVSVVERVRHLTERVHGVADR